MIRMKHILSIDGGGMRGIVSAVLLKSLEEKLQYYSGNREAKIADYFDMIAGTSTGAVLAVLYLYPTSKGESKYSASQILDMYLDFGKQIFKKNILFPLVGSKYTDKGLKRLLNEYFSDTTVADLRKACLLTSYNTEQREAVFFNTISSRKDEKRNCSLVDAVMASAAVPAVFPPRCLNYRRGCLGCYIDGGVVANNPALCALIETLKLPRCEGMEDVILLSVGNVSSKKPYPYSKVKYWGAIQWVEPIFAILADSNEQVTDYQLNRMFKAIHCSKNYYRMQWRADEPVPAIDAVTEEAIGKLAQYGEMLSLRERYHIEELARRLTGYKS